MSAFWLMQQSLFGRLIILLNEFYVYMPVCNFLITDTCGNYFRTIFTAKDQLIKDMLIVARNNG